VDRPRGGVAHPLPPLLGGAGAERPRHLGPDRLPVQHPVAVLHHPEPDAQTGGDDGRGEELHGAQGAADDLLARGGHEDRVVGHALRLRPRPPEEHGRSRVAG
jgi:hypothetical protein